MPTTNDDKATASLLLSTDEAVAEKIRRVLTQHPEIVAEAMKRVEETIMMQRKQAEYQRALHQSMMATNQAAAARAMNSTYASSNTSGLLSNTYNNSYGGKK